MTDFLLLFLVCQCALLVYIQTLWGEFVFDDLLVLDTVKRNMTIRKMNSIVYQWRWARAFLWWTFQRDGILHGFDVRGWHATNISIHVIATALMYTILRWWFGEMSAFAGALIFAAHPIGTASVSSISGRSSELCGMFYLAALLSYLIGWWYLVPVFAFLGLKSKEEIVILPAALVAFWWWG